MKHIIRILPLLLFCQSAFTQPYYFRHYQVENGLSNNTVFCSIQDSKGFMWFGTKDGISRFDGYRFKVFNISYGDESSLTRDEIHAFALDPEGNLLVGSQKGLYRFDAPKERLVPFIDTLNNIDDLLVDKQGQLWFLSAAMVCRYNFSTKRLALFPTERYFSATSLCQTPDGQMWFSTANGYLMRYNEATQQFKAHDLFLHSPPPASRLVEKIAPGENGVLYIGTSSQGLKQFDLSTLDYNDILTYNADKTTIYVRDILQTARHEFWIATESGLFILDTETGKFTNLRKKYLDPYSLSDNAIYSLHKDREGGIWVGTYFGGINYFTQQSTRFQKYFPDYSRNSISGSAVREICEDGRGNIWIGTEDAGLNKLDPITGQFTCFEPTGSPQSISYTNIHGLLAVANELWIGTFEHGLDIMDVGTGQVKKHYNAGPGPHDLKANFIVCLLQTRKGDIYLGSSNSVFKYLPETDAFQRIEEVEPGLFISCMLEDKQGTIWAGTHDGGVYYFNPVTREKGHFKNDPANKNSLTTNTINALYEDSFQDLWFATEGGGLCRFNQARNLFTRYTTRNGLPSNFVFKVLEDSKQNLWATTSKGLVKLELRNQATTVYTKANGLLNDQFNYNSGYKDASGKMYFGSVKGMITFKPDDFFQPRFTPPVYITGFQVHNNELEIGKEGASGLQQSIVNTNQITLPYNQSSFSIDFAAISFVSPEMTRYSYRMSGLDKDWINLKSNRKVYFTNLEPGTYQFRLKIFANGRWNQNEKILTIRILPPFWATGWAYLIYIVLGVSLLYYGVRTYHRMVINKKEKDIYEAKIEFFTNIAHEIKTPLTLIKGPVENLSELVSQVPEIQPDVATMERNTNRLINLINQILDFRQTEAGGFSLDFHPVNISELLREAFVTFEPLAKKRKLQYNLNLPIQDVHILADDEALNKIFSNLFSNAVKYAEGEVHASLLPFHKNSNQLVIEITNDGFVVPDDMKEKIFEPFVRLKETSKQKGAGIGLSLARSLVQLHKGYLFMRRGEKKNVFVMSLPYPALPDRKKKATKGNTFIRRSTKVQ
ncbi:MAG: histidine kinase [Williamsia sp.]|nr:histidine kinase [Williamsia sp.]